MSNLLDRPISTGSTWYDEQVLAWHGSPTDDDLLQPVSPPGRSIRIVVPVGAPRHQESLAQHLESEINGLLQLKDGWDGERASEITMDAAKATIPLVWQAFSDIALLPLLFPLPDGGIQAEWHAGQESVEIEVDEIGDAHLLITDETGAIVVNRALPGADSLGISQARTAVDKLSARVLSSR